MASTRSKAGSLDETLLGNTMDVLSAIPFGVTTGSTISHLNVSRSDMGTYVVFRTVDPSAPNPNDFNWDGPTAYHFGSKQLSWNFLESEKAFGEFLSPEEVVAITPHENRDTSGDFPRDPELVERALLKLFVHHLESIQPTSYHFADDTIRRNLEGAIALCAYAKYRGVSIGVTLF